MISVRIFKSKSQWKLGCNLFRGSFQNKNILEQSVYPSWQARLILWPAAGCSQGAFPLSPPVSKWTSCNKWRQIASASLNNGDYRLEGGETRVGRQTVCGELPIISGSRVKGRSHAGGHWEPPKHAGQDFLKRKLPLFNQNMLVRIFYSENCHFWVIRLWAFCQTCN